MRILSNVTGLLLWGAVCVMAAETNSASPARIERENTFEFAAKPEAAKKDGVWLVSFASKAACDATVAVVGPDGKIVRHLASGVLGKNAPAPFQKDSLAQKIEWDGKDDQGKPAPAGSNVKVSLGMKPRMDKLFPEEATGYAGAVGLACDREGLLYVLNALDVRVFNKDGDYVRTIWPPPSGSTPERMALINWNQTTWGSAVPMRQSAAGGVFGLFRPEMTLLFNQNPVVTSDGRLVMITDTFNGTRRLVFMDTKDGGVLPSGLIALGEKPDRLRPVQGQGRIIFCLSADEKMAYFGGVPKGGWGQPAVDAVMRVALAQPEKIEKFAGDPAVPGSDDAHLKGATGIACDKDGNVYVCDTGNNRIQVFKADRSLAKSIPLEAARQIRVHPVNGAIYVLCLNKKAKLVRFGGLNALDKKIEMELPSTQFGADHVMGLDSSSTTTSVWVAMGGAYMGAGLWRIEDRGDAFEKVLDAATLTKKAAGWKGWTSGQGGGKQYITADPFREELYLRLGDCCFPSDVIRVNGRTGEVIERLGLRVEQCYMGPDKLLYLRIEDGGEWLVRYNPDTKKMVPFTAPEVQPVRANGYGTKRYDFTKRNTVTYRGEPVTGIYAPGHPGARTWQDFFGVAPNGDIYVPNGLLPEHIAELAKSNEAPPANSAGIGNCLLQVYSSEGKLKCFNALPGLGTSAGIRIGRDGAVYTVLQAQPAGIKVPDGIAATGNFEANKWATLVKFDSHFDKYPLGRIQGKWDKSKPAKVTHNHGNNGGSFSIGGTGGGQPVGVEGMLWDYPGVSPVTMSGCVCMNSHFDLDRFDRSFVPAAQTFSVNALDSNGNLIMRIGSYGNIDASGKDGQIGLSFPRFVAVSDEAVYVHDCENQRIARIALGYAVEETVALR